MLFYEEYQREDLIDVALGNEPPDLVIRGGKLVNVHTSEVHQADILIKGNRIAAIATNGDSYNLSVAKKIINAKGQFLIPGLIDPHMHLESSSVTATQFARAVVPRGVTTIAVDPHELGNVLGLKGIELLLTEARSLPIHLLIRVPARVPEFPEHLETPGAVITNDQTRCMLQWPESVCLAGDVHPNLILNKDPYHLAKIGFTYEEGKTVSGYSPGLKGKELNSLLAAGLEDSHTPKDISEMLDDLRHGLHVLLTPRPFKFEEDEFEKLAVLIQKNAIDTRMISFCTDDIHTNQLITEGHLDYRVRLAIRKGLNPITAIQMATINTANLLRLDRDLGSIKPGKIADICILNDLDDFLFDKIIVRGNLVAENGRMVVDLPDFEYPEWVRHSMNNMASPIDTEDLQIQLSDDYKEVSVRVLMPGSPKTCHTATLKVKDRVLYPDQNQDILSVAVIDRYRGSGNVGKGFIGGFGIKNGAVASSINHNAHNLFVMGTNFPDMVLAINGLIEMGGGYYAVSGGKVCAQVELPIAGLLSNESYEAVGDKFDKFERALIDTLGCTLAYRPLWTLNFICSPVVPNYGITDVGLLNSSINKIEDVVLKRI